MKRSLLLVVLISLLLMAYQSVIAREQPKKIHNKAVVQQTVIKKTVTKSTAIKKVAFQQAVIRPKPQINKPALQCAAFSPYVGQLNPDYGVHPPKELINELLDKLIKETPFRCIMTYGVLNGLDAIFSAAKERQLKVIAILWIDKDTTINTQSISRGIALAREFPDTIIKLSCGSEVRVRNGYKFDSEVIRCLDALHEAKVSQPITAIDIWWEWCNKSQPCHATSFAEKVDWIGINVFPWWENKFSGAFPCTTAQQAADFHLARLEEVQRTYPNKEVIITEFGWPNAPEGSAETNAYTQQKCGIASKANQTYVVQTTFKKLAASKQSGVVFEAFSENWKPSAEGNFGRYWGICQGKPPYTCTENLMPRMP